MSDNYFPKRKYLFNANSGVDYYFKPVYGGETDAAITFTLNPLSDDATYRTWTILNPLTSQGGGGNYPNDWTSNHLTIPFIEHIPNVWIRGGQGSAFDYSDMTSYEAALVQKSPFAGDMTLDIYNADPSSIQIIPIYNSTIDQSASGTFCDGIIGQIDIPSVVMIPKAVISGTKVFMEIGRLDASNVVTDRTRVELTTNDVDNSTICSLPVGKYLFLFTSSSEHIDNSTAVMRNMYFGIGSILQGSVIRFSDRTALKPYYSGFEHDTTNTYHKVENVSTQATLDLINGNNGKICVFSMKSSEPAIYHRKYLTFNNTSATSIDTTVVITDGTGGIIYTSNDSSFSTEIWLPPDTGRFGAGYTISVYSNSFSVGNTYDLTFNFVVTPCLPEASITSVANILP